MSHHSRADVESRKPMIFADFPPLLDAFCARERRRYECISTIAQQAEKRKMLCRQYTRKVERKLVSATRSKVIPSLCHRQPCPCPASSRHTCTVRKLVSKSGHRTDSSVRSRFKAESSNTLDVNRTTNSKQELIHPGRTTTERTRIAP